MGRDDGDCDGARGGCADGDCDGDDSIRVPCGSDHFKDDDGNLERVRLQFDQSLGSAAAVLLAMRRWVMLGLKHFFVLQYRWQN